MRIRGADSARTDYAQSCVFSNYKFRTNYNIGAALLGTLQHRYGLTVIDPNEERLHKLSCKSDAYQGDTFDRDCINSNCFTQHHIVPYEFYFMPNFEILYDEPHEANWFSNLHPDFKNATVSSITSASKRPQLQSVLAYDRPDIILLDNGWPILVVEETVEVPSGHNVGQRFSRIAAAAEAKIPCVYFGPYVAKKHGGETAGPRYMNLRLFHAIDKLIQITGTAVTTINWPVDANCEIMKGGAKDADMKEYISLFLHLHYTNPSNINQSIINSSLQARLNSERNHFITTKITNPTQYLQPPNSVSLLSLVELVRQFPHFPANIINASNGIVLYNVGMKEIRSDPYTGMALLYKYLYKVLPGKKLVLWFPEISYNSWNTTPSSRKDKKLFTIASDAIIFKDYITA